MCEMSCKICNSICMNSRTDLKPITEDQLRKMGYVLCPSMNIENVHEREFVAEFITDSCIERVCKENTIEELLKSLLDLGYCFHEYKKDRIVNWSRTTHKQFHTPWITITQH